SAPPKSKVTSAPSLSRPLSFGWQLRGEGPKRERERKSNKPTFACTEHCEHLTVNRKKWPTRGKRNIRHTHSDDDEEWASAVASDERCLRLQLGCPHRGTYQRVI